MSLNIKSKMYFFDFNNVIASMYLFEKNIFEILKLLHLPFMFF